jgi:hypothetical protein
MKMRFMLLLCAAVALTVGIGTAAAGGGNSDAAKACQNGGWQNLVRQDGTGFSNQGDCVSYAAQGGVLKAKSTCTTGSENFSEFTTGTPGDTPTTFSGGTIDTAYGYIGGVYLQNPYFPWQGSFTDGTHVLFSGKGATPFRLTFNNAVKSVELDADPNSFADVTQTLTAYDASNNVVDTDSGHGTVAGLNHLTVSSGVNNIKYFTIDTTTLDGVGFSNISWTCS